MATKVARHLRHAGAENICSACAPAENNPFSPISGIFSGLLSPNELDGGSGLSCILTPIPLDGDSASIRNFGHNDTNRSRNGKSVVEAQ